MKTDSHMNWMTFRFGSTKEDFLAAIMDAPGDQSPSANFAEGACLCLRTAEHLPLSRRTEQLTRPSPLTENYALVSPDRDWQDRLQSLLQVSGASQQRIPQLSYAHQQSPTSYALPSFRQLSSPVHQSSHQQQQPTHNMLSGGLQYQTQTKHESPVSAAAMLAPLQQQPQSSQQQQQQHTYTQHDQSAYTRPAMWDGFNGYSRIPGMWFVSSASPSVGTPTDDDPLATEDVLRDDQESKRASYELGPVSPDQQSASRDAYQSMPRCSSAAAAAYVPYPPAYPARHQGY